MLKGFYKKSKKKYKKKRLDKNKNFCYYYIMGFQLIKIKFKIFKNV